MGKRHPTRPAKHLDEPPAMITRPGAFFKQKKACIPLARRGSPGIPQRNMEELAFIGSSSTIVAKAGAKRARARDLLCKPSRRKGWMYPKRWTDF